MDAFILLRVAIALSFVAACILGVMMLMRRSPSLLNGNRKRERLMSIEEVLSLDTKRRLIRVRRENMMYVLLLSAESEQLVERYSVSDTATASAPSQGDLFSALESSWEESPKEKLSSTTPTLLVKEFQKKEPLASTPQKETASSTHMEFDSLIPASPFSAAHTSETPPTTDETTHTKNDNRTLAERLGEHDLPQSEKKTKSPISSRRKGRRNG